MRGQGKAEVAMTVNDALSGQLGMLLGMMTLQAYMCGFSWLLAVSTDEYLVPPSETPWNDISPSCFCLYFPLLFCFGLSKIYCIVLLEIHRRYSQKVSQLSSVSLILEQGKREVLQHSSHFSYDEPCQTIWWNTLLMWLITLKHSLVASN